MKKLLPILFVLIITSCSDPKLTTSDKLVERNGIVFFENSTTPFTGEIVDYYNPVMLKMTGSFVDGIKEGKWDTYHLTGYDTDNGNLKTTGNFVGGIKEGKWDTYDDKGNLIMTGSFVDGKKEGQWDIFFKNPRSGNPTKEYEEHYTSGEKNGKFISFERDGREIKSTTRWIKGVFEEQIDFEGKGDIWRKSVRKKNKIYVYRYPNGLGKIDENYQGKVSCEITDMENNIIRNSKSSHTDGIQNFDNLSFYTWKNCELNGVYESYSGGRIQEKGFYENDKKTGQWISNNSSTGDPYKIKTFKNGKQDGLSQYFYHLSTTVEREEKYNNGFKESETYFHEDGTVDVEKTYTKDGRSQVKEYTTVFASYSESGTKHTRHPAFYNAIVPFYKYLTTFECREDTMQDGIYMFGIDCTVFQMNRDPITITTSYHGRSREGLFQISDTVSGHVYTSVNYFRDGKLGEYKVTNKDGLVVYSVTCLKGGAAFSVPGIGGNGSCRKDGEEILYTKTPYTKNKEHFLVRKSFYKNGELISKKIYKDPFRKEELRKEFLGNMGKIIIPYKENEYKILRNLDDGPMFSSKIYVIPK